MKISSNQKFNTLYFFIFFVLFISINLSNGINSVHADQKKHKQNSNDIEVFREVFRDALTMINKDRETFRYDTFGDESFWGDGIRRGVAIFAKACFGHPSPSKRQKLNATTNAFGAPDVLRTCHFATIIVNSMLAS